MSPTIEEQIEQLKNTIAEIEAKAGTLGETVVQMALEPLREKLAELNRQFEAIKAPQPEKFTQQRKLITILFMDIVGSTAMIQHMDPEDVSEVIDHNLKLLAQPIVENGGRVTSFTGDGFMAIFGAPAAREDDPEQAVRAGLAVIQQSDTIAKELEKDREILGFKVRVGINTGLVLLGGETEGEDTTKGSAVHLAARLQAAAPPGGMLISHDTYRHIRGVFNVEPQEPLKVKGFDDPVQVYRVISAKPRAFRSYTRGVEGVETRMVGRQSELKYLQDAYWSAVEESEGQVVSILGDAGVGKSRLLYEFQNWIDLQLPFVVFYEGRAHQEAQGMPLATLRDLFEFRFQILESDNNEIVQEKVEAGFNEIFGKSDDSQMRVHILGQWLGFDFSLSPHLLGVLADPEQLRNRGLMYLAEYFKGLSDRQPVIIFLEDIHWADDSSLDTINWLGERLYHNRILFACAARHSLLERRPYWGEGLENHHRLILEPLTKRESHQLVGEILKLADQVPSELIELIVEGAEGNPFYVEELIKMLVEDGVVVKGEESWHVKAELLSDIKVPPTLAGVLQARMESLPSNEQQVLQQASVVGRLFWDRAVEYIQSTEGGKPELVPEWLASLRSREMVYRREASLFTDAREYLFKHDILREVTYESVLKRLRKKYHSLVADWLIDQVADRMGEYSGLIARHLLHADKGEQAGAYFLLAGQAALESYANHEAERYFRQALELPCDDERKAACQAGLGVALSRRGSRQEAVEMLRKSIELYIAMGSSDTAADLYTRLARVQWYDDYQKGWNTCQEGLRRLEGAPDSPGMASLLAETARCAYFLGKSVNKITLLCQQTIDMAERLGEPAIRAEAMITLAGCIPDIDQNLHQLQEVVVLCESENLWDTATRAHVNLASTSLLFYRNIESVYQHNMRAIEIAIHTGNIERLIIYVENIADVLIELGNLMTSEDKLREILRRTIASQSQVDELLDRHLQELLYPKGEWSQAVEYYQQLVVNERQRSRYQELARVNTLLAFSCLELNRFKDFADLSQAEAAVQENLTLDWPVSESIYLPVIVSARQGRLTEARERLKEIDNYINPQFGKNYEVHRLRVESELAIAERRWDAAITNSQALIDIYKARGYRWKEARQLIDLGDAFMGRDLPGDHEQAKHVFLQALEMFTEMGAVGYIQVLEERLGKKGIH